MINVGIAGIGFMGMIHYLAYRKLPEMNVKALCERRPERLKGDWTAIQGNFGPRGEMMDLTGIDTYDDYDAMIADDSLDMIDICLPPNLHPEMTLKALEAGHDVFCEKPISLQVDDAEKMVKAAKKAERLLMIGHVLPFFSGYDFVYKAYKSGKYGKVLGGNFSRVISDPTWLENFYSMETCGGPLLDLHIHDAHFIRLLFGMPKAVQSVGRMRNDVPSYFNTQFLFDEPDLVVTATSGVIDQQGRPFTCGFEIHFEKATLLFDVFMNMPVTVLTADGKVEQPKLPEGDEVDFFAGELKEAYQAVKNETPSSMLDGQLARDALVMCHRQIDSIQKQKQIKL